MAVNNILIGGNKAQQVHHFATFIRDKYKISLDELDEVTEVDLKTWINDNWEWDLGLVSAFVSFGMEDDYINIGVESECLP